jgi:hypothetical protein
MMIVAVEDEDARFGASKRLRSRNPGEAAADDDDARFALGGAAVLLHNEPSMRGRVVDWASRRSRLKI